MINTPYTIIHDEIIDALNHKKPLVALESSVFCQGLPEHQCDDAQTSIEQTIRDAGAIPATICLFEGKIHVGCSHNIRKKLLELRHHNKIFKIAERDIAHALASGRSGGTTVSATSFIAYKVGIKIFATGGIGGVHRGDGLDISSDLKSLSQYPIMVFCAGIKSILDVPKTLELLETASVPVFSYRSDYFPNFYCDKSFNLSPRRIDSLEELINVFVCRSKLSQKEAILLGNPFVSKNAIDTQHFEIILQTALEQAQKENISFQNTTPYLLEYMAKHHNEDTVKANIELIKNNAQLAAQSAILLSNILA
ncbi:MAG: pseudouridine-5'-phosphate glycosidase [Myxococcales bacterium]|nr:MAG: pseudouridine-5'-phosphate glycosidase [Myxococcales bacterium]